MHAGRISVEIPVLHLKGSQVEMGAQCLSGRVLDSRSRSCGLESHRQHSVVSLSKTY